MKTPTLDAALLKLQADRPKLVKTRVADVETKGGGYSYTFADLAQVADAVLPVLAQLGVLWATEVDVEVVGEQWRRVLRWRLTHVETQETRKGTWPLAGENPQAVGSALTFGRRYCLVTATGLTPEDDDDALAAESERAAELAAGRGTARRAQSDRRRPAPTGGTAQRATRPAAGRPPLPRERQPVSRDQLTRIRLSLDEFGVAERQDKLGLVQMVVGRPIGSSTDLTIAEASTVIDVIESARSQPDPGTALWDAAGEIADRRREQAPPPEDEGGQSDG